MNHTGPQCNRQSKRTDIRRIYAKSIKVLDNAELEKAVKDLENEKQLRKKSEIEVSEVKLRFKLVRDELSVLQHRYNTLMEKFNSIGNDQNTAPTQRSMLTTDRSNGINFNQEKLIQLTDVNNLFFLIKILSIFRLKQI